LLKPESPTTFRHFPIKNNKCYCLPKCIRRTIKKVLDIIHYSWLKILWQKQVFVMIWWRF